MGPIIVITLLAAQAGTGADPVPISVRIEETLLSTPAKSPASPRGNPGNWANSNDYPSRALREEQEGVTRFRLIVGADGRASHCEIRQSSGSRALDQATCTVIKRRARFNVALDDRGNPIEGNWSSSVRWQIPNGTPPRLSAIARLQKFVVTAEGGLAKCGKGVPDYPPPGSDQSCDPTLAYVPFRDAKGQPVARQVTITTTRSIADAE